MVAIDGSKYRAWNGRKRNFNQKKLEQKYTYLDAKINEYIETLEKYDQEEGSELKPNKETIVKKIEELKARRKTYESYEEEIKETGDYFCLLVMVKYIVRRINLWRRCF